MIHGPTPDGRSTAPWNRQASVVPSTIAGVSLISDRQSDSRSVEETLSKPDVHDKWESDFRTAQNARFYDAALRYIGGQLDPSVRPGLLDAGCGIGDYALRLARQGFSVTGIDFSEAALENARAYLAQDPDGERVTLRRESLLDLSFEDGAFDAILCWGVLMHIPDVGAATSELARTLRPGGRLAISETNMRSIEAVSLRRLRRLTGRGARTVKTEAGVEHWADGSAGDLMTRESDIGWLVRRFDHLGLDLRSRCAGQFSESYVRVDNPIGLELIHRLNWHWFHRVGWAGPAIGNILIFEKRS